MSDMVETMQGVAHHALTQAGGTLVRTLRARLPHGTGPTPTSLDLAPECLLRGDAERAKEFYRGCFTLAGERIELGARSPFECPAAPRRWQDALRSFAWLADLSEAGHALPRAQARTLIAEWIARHGRKPDADWALPLVSARLLAWLRHAPFYLENAGEDFHRALLHSMGRQIRTLTAHLARGGGPAERLRGAIALASCVTCMAGLDKLRERAHDHLARELEAQILPDGGHVSRDPGILLDLLGDLVPLRDAFVARQVAPPAALPIALDRAIPFLASLIHGDGGLAFFNGAGGVRRKAVAEIFARAREARKPLANARHSGYMRLAEDRTLAIVDTGRPAAPGRDGAGHAGCLSFELSHGTSRIVVNCGHCADGPPEWQAATRATAAHSTLTVDDRSSGRILSHPWVERLAGGPLVIGPARAEATSETSATGSLVTARHDGYARATGLIHQREIFVAAGGGDVRGEDRLYDAGRRGGNAAGHEFAIRFHLHPAVKATLSQDGRSVLVMLPNRSGWKFTARGAPPALEESVYFDGRNVPQRTQQIVLGGPVEQSANVKWAFRLLDAPPKRDTRPGTARLPLQGGSMNGDTET